VLGLLADALSPIADYLTTSTNPVEDAGTDFSLAGLLGESVRPAAVTADRLSYGEPLTTGRGMTLQMRPETRDVLLGAAPMVGPAGRGAMTVGKAAGKELSPQIEKTLMDFMRRQGGIKDIFIGEGAKTWDKSAASKFVDLEESGVSNKDAYMQTGTFRSPDGKLRQEIDDSQAISNVDAVRNELKESVPFMVEPFGQFNSSVGKVYSNPELFKAYPDLAGMPFRSEIGSGSVLQPASKGKPSAMTLGMNADARTVMPHEIQHAIQDYEGFARGGSEKEFLNDPLFNWKMSPFEAYKSLAGEAEARATQARINMTPEQRRLSFPLESYDVPLNQLIIQGLLK
jgi:hypothetical protein